MPDSQRSYHKDADSWLTERKGVLLEYQRCQWYDALPFICAEAARRWGNAGTVFVQSAM